MESNKNLRIGIISDGKYGERAFKNIAEKYPAEWITVPDIDPSIMIVEELNLNIPSCDLYISYVHHPDIILQLSELQKPLILGVMPGIGLYYQAKNINNKVKHAPTMCSLKNDTGIQELDIFLRTFGKPEYDIIIDEENVIKNIVVKRASFCGSSVAGVKFLKDRKISKVNLEQFSLNICHECRAPRFGHTCDKEVADIIHLNTIFEKIPIEPLKENDPELINFIKNMKIEYEKRTKMSKQLLNQVG